MQRLTGLIAATYTPSHSDPRRNDEAVEALAKRLPEDGVAGVFICGTTGEFASITTDECRRTCERWVQATRGDFPVVQHVGGTSLEDSQALAAHAQEVGADAIACIAPYFFRPASVEDLVEYCAAVAAAAPERPFYYYHLPALTGVSFPMAEFLRVARSRIPTLAGIKFSHWNLSDFLECIEFEDRRYNMLFGCDEMLLGGLATGCDGAVGTTYGFAAPLYRAILDAFAAGDIDSARRLQARSVEMINIFCRHGGHRAMKAVMKIVGIDCGSIRRPLAPISEEEFTVISAELAAIGFDEYRSGSLRQEEAR